MWIKDGVKFSDSALRAAHPNTTFPATIEQHNVEDFGYFKLIETPSPDANEYEYAEETKAELVEGNWVQTWTIKQHGPEKIQQILVSAVQLWLDSEARKYGYDDIKSAVTYAEEPEVVKFQAEGKAFRKWRSAVWAACYTIMDDVLAGKREIPSTAELMKELPILSL